MYKEGPRAHHRKGHVIFRRNSSQKGHENRAKMALTCGGGKKVKNGGILVGPVRAGPLIKSRATSIFGRRSPPYESEQDRQTLLSLSTYVAR